MKDKVKRMIDGLAKNPRSIEYEEERTPNKRFVVIKPKAHDYGRIIGGQGKTLQAIRRVAWEIGAAIGTEAHVICERPDQEETEPKIPFEPDPDYDPEPIQSELEWLLIEIEPRGLHGKVERQKASLHTTIYLVRSKVLAQADLADALTQIYHAWGKARGHYVFVDIDSQPAKTAA